MTNVDDQVVEMSFLNAAFERGVSVTLNTLNKLKESIAGVGSSSPKIDTTQAQGSLAKLHSAANRVDMSSITSQAEGISKSFVAASTVAITALATITASALREAGNLAKGFAIEPVTGGFDEYGLKLNAIQTIMAGTGEDIDTVTAALAELNTYSDKTIFSFKDMIDNIPKFTNAGVALDDAVASIQGVSQVAAVSGASASEAARAMYNLGQAIGQGHVKLLDWKSVELANMGTTEFKQQLIDTAEAMGTLTKAGDGTWKTLEGTEVTTKNFSTTLQDQWLTSKALIGTLKKYTSTTTELGKKAWDSATDIKTFTQLLGIMKESVGSGWAQSFEIMFGNLEEAKDLWGGVGDVLGGFVTKSANARNKVLTDWKEMGGKAALITGIKKAFTGLLDIMRPFKQAFHDIFPAQTGKSLTELSENFKNFAKGLKISQETSEGLRRTFRGVFAIFSIVGQVIGAVVHAFANLFGEVGDNSGSILDFTGGIGDMIVKFDQWLEKSGVLTSFFSTLGSLLAVPIALISSLAQVIGSIFTGFDTKAAGDVVDAVDKFGNAVKPSEAIANRIRGVFQKLGNLLQSVAGKIKEGLGKIGDFIAESITPSTFDRTLDVINTTLLGGIILLIRKFFKQGVSVDLTGGLFKDVSRTLGEATTALQNMQQNLKANILLKIAAALAILTGSLFVLSTIDSASLTKALGAMSVGFGALIGTMVALMKVMGPIGIVQIYVVAGAMTKLALAMLLLAFALKILSGIKPGDLARGLGAMGASLWIMQKALIPLAAGSPGMAKAATSLVLVGGALILIAVAMKIFATMKWEEIAKGLVAMTGALGGIGLALQLMPKNMVVTAAGLILVGIALGLIAGSMKIFATMKWEEIAKGIVGIAGALLVIAGAMQLMPANLPITAAGLILVGIALGEIAAVSKIFATMSWEEMGKAAAALAGALLIIAGGMYLMSGALPGAAALLVVAGALTILTPVLLALGAMSWEAIGKGLITLAGALTIIGLAGLLLTPVIPSLLGLGVALVLIGAGFALGGAGALAFATAFGIFVASGAAGLALISALIGLIPEFAREIAEGVIEFVKGIVKGSDELLAAWISLLLTLIKGVTKVMPQIGKMMHTLVQTAIRFIRKDFPDIATAGSDLLLALLRAIRKNTYQMTTVAIDIVLEFIRAFEDKFEAIADRAAKAIIAFIDAITLAMHNNRDELNRAAIELAEEIVKGMVKGIEDGAKAIAGAAKDAAKGALNAAKDFLGINSPSKEFMYVGEDSMAGMALGLERKAPTVAQKAKKAAEKILSAFREGVVGSQDEVKTAFDDLKNQLKDNMKESEDAVTDAQAKLKQAKKTKDPKKIDKAQKALDQAKETRHENTKAFNEFIRQQKAQQDKLKVQAKEWERVSAALAAAQDVLKQLQDNKLSMQESVTDQFNQKTDIQAGQSLSTYMKQMEKQREKVEKFNTTLAALRAAGLSDESYRKLLAEGVDAQRLMDQMLAGGSGAIEGFDMTNDQMAASAAALGTTAANELYDAGIAAAQGIVNGLTADLGAIEGAMDKIARLMVKAIKKALGINSPSKEGISIGKFFDKGIIEGLMGYSENVNKAAEDVANSALDTLQATMNTIGDSIQGEFDMNPVITPVLDLTKMANDASRISSILAANPLEAIVSYSQAAQIAEDTKPDTSDDDEVPTGTNVSLTQNNYSPKAIGAVETYRQTKSLFSLVVGEVDF